MRPISPACWARDAISELGIADLAARRIGELSGGQRQLVFMAQVLAAGPVILLLDEPTSALDIALLSGGRLLATGLPAEVLVPMTLRAAYGVEMCLLAAPDGFPVVLPTRDQRRQ